jgi:hypothetical protein
MKAKLLLLLVLFSIFCFVQSTAQVSNLTVNGSSTNFTMISGDTLHWQFNVSPVGATAVIEIWLDVNQNGVIDPGTDFLWQALMQTDGDTNGGNGGPPDMDGNANGVIVVIQKVGLAPGKYVMRVTEGGVSLAVAGTINHLTSPAHTISGQVTVPAGRSAANIFIEAHRDGQYNPNFWDGITNGSGNYTIEMTADTAGNPWSVNVSSNPYAPAFVTPSEQNVIVATNVTGVNFAITAAAAQVGGYLKDGNGLPLVGKDVTLASQDNGPGVQYSGRADINGLFRIGVGNSDLIAGRHWRLSAEVENSQVTVNYLTPSVTLLSLNAADSIFKNLTIFAVNSQITGTVHVNGGPPGSSLLVVAQSADTAQATAMCDGSTGNFTLPVTSKIYSYSIFAGNLPPNYSGNSVTAHPGNTGVAVNLIMTGIAGSTQSMPTEYSLHQNYPNPFNPSTTIGYGLPQRSRVTLAIYSTLGQRVALLVNGDNEAGYHEVTFDGSGLASGVYFYRIQVGNFVQTKGLLLLR